MTAVVKDTNGLSLISSLPFRPLESNELRIEIKATSLCRTDVYLANGDLSASFLPIVLGHECSGVVTEAGPGSAYRLGERVMVFPFTTCGTCEACLQQRFQQCPNQVMLGRDRDGVFASHCVVPEASVFPIPPSFNFQLACFFEPVVAAYGVLNVSLSPFDRIAILGRNRFSEMMRSILRFENFRDVTIISEEDISRSDEMSFDYVIDAQLSFLDADNILRLIRPGGSWILKSRVPGSIKWSPLPLIEREISVRPVHYGSIELGLKYLEGYKDDLESLIGPTFSFSEFDSAVKADSHDPTHKVFFDPSF